MEEGNKGLACLGQLDSVDADVSCHVVSHSTNNGMLDLSELDAEATHLDLGVLAAKVVDRAVRVVAHQIAGPVESTGRLVGGHGGHDESRVLDKDLLLLVRSVDITCSNEATFYEKLTNGTDRYQLIWILSLDNPHAAAACVAKVKRIALNGQWQRDSRADSGLGGTIADQYLSDAKPGLDSFDIHRLATQDYSLQGRNLLRLEDLGHLRSQEGDIDAHSAHRSSWVFGTLFVGWHAEASTRRENSNGLGDVSIEGICSELEHSSVWAEIDLGSERAARRKKRAMLDDNTFGLSCRTRSEGEVCNICGVSSRKGGFGQGK